VDTLKYNVDLHEWAAPKQSGEIYYAVGGGGGGSPVTVLTTLEIIELLKEKYAYELVRVKTAGRSDLSNFS
jgi:hypothetical protein